MNLRFYLSGMRIKDSDWFVPLCIVRYVKVVIIQICQIVIINYRDRIWTSDAIWKRFFEYVCIRYVKSTSNNYILSDIANVLYLIHDGRWRIFIYRAFVSYLWLYRDLNYTKSYYTFIHREKMALSNVRLLIIWVRLWF